MVLNAADPFGKDNDEAAAIIREKEYFEYFPSPIVRRKAFRNVAAAGLSVLEYRPPDEKAIHEFGLFAAHVSDMLAISLSHPIPIAKHPSRKIKMNDKRAEKFIMAGAGDEIEEEGRFVQTPIRFPPALLARIDRAAKKRGLNLVAGFVTPSQRNWILRAHEFECQESAIRRQPDDSRLAARYRIVLQEVEPYCETVWLDQVRRAEQRAMPCSAKPRFETRR